jgi:hypothetical protein
MEALRRRGTLNNKPPAYETAMRLALRNCCEEQVPCKRLFRSTREGTYMRGGCIFIPAAWNLSIRFEKAGEEKTL